MDARSEFLVYLGAALTTIAVLFVGQIWYASYLDVAVVHAQNLDAPADAKVEAVRNQERAKLSGGAVPIDQAMRTVAEEGRAASPKLAAQVSDDLSAMSGWVHRPGFAPYVPRKAQAPVVPETTDGGVPVEGAPVEGAAEAEAAEAAPIEAAPKPRIAVGFAKPAVAKPAVAKPAVAKPKVAAPAPTAAPQTP